MTTLLLGLIALTIGLVALGLIGFHPRRQVGMRISLRVLGVSSTIAGIAFLIQVGGILLPVANLVGLVILLPSLFVLVHLIWSAIQFIDSLDKEPKARVLAPRPDLSILNEMEDAQEPQPGRRRSFHSRRTRRSAARERMAKIEFLTGH